MTPQTIVGLVLLVMGVAVKVAAAAAWIPGDVSFIGEITNLGVLLLGKELMPASAAAQKRTSNRPPPAAGALLVLPLLFLLGGCATLRDIKPVARDVNNIARELCETTMGAEAERQGLPVRELCAISYIIAPFLQAPQLASANAVLGRELTVHECPQ